MESAVHNKEDIGSGRKCKKPLLMVGIWLELSTYVRADGPLMFWLTSVKWRKVQITRLIIDIPIYAVRAENVLSRGLA